MHNLATLYVKLDRDGDAEVLFLQTVSAKRRVLGDEHPVFVKRFRLLASFYTKQRRYQEAESAALAAYEGFVKRLGNDDNSTQRVVAQLGELYAAAGQPDKAQRDNRCEAAKQIRRQVRSS